MSYFTTALFQVQLVCKTTLKAMMMIMLSQSNASNVKIIFGFSWICLTLQLHYSRFSWSAKVNFKELLAQDILRPGHTKFLFSGRKKNWNFRTFFRTSESQKNAFFVIPGAYNFGTFRAEAKITIRRHEVVYRQSSERKMIIIIIIIIQFL